MANLKNYLQSARKENKTVDAIEPTIDEEQRRTALVQRLIQGTISLAEARELRTLLERERHMLTQRGNCLAFFAARFLTDYVDEYLQSKSSS